MKKTTRNNVFETNSSSTHSLCISNTRNVLDCSDARMYIRLGEFGWEHERYHGAYEIASYVYTGALYNKDYELVKLMKEILPNCEFENPGVKFYYIDHGNELQELFEEFKKNPNKLLNFIFGKKSFIVTGNDNSDERISCEIPEGCEEYYKGN